MISSFFNPQHSFDLSIWQSVNAQKGISSSVSSTEPARLGVAEVVGRSRAAAAAFTAAGAVATASAAQEHDTIASNSVVYLSLPSLSFHLRVCSLPST